MSRRIVIGDIHGHYSHLFKLLRFDAEVIRDDLTWCGEDTTVIFIGDYVDRGPDGIRVIDLLISLQIQADMLGGKVIPLIGNHDLLLVSAQRFGDRSGKSSFGTFMQAWLANGGEVSDLEHLTPEHIAWLTTLPAMVLLEDHLLFHGDTMLYLEYGQTIEAVNKAFEDVMYSFDPKVWDHLLEQFSEHEVFANAWDGMDKARKVLDLFGGKKIVHGHTPIGKMIPCSDDSVIAPYIYNEGLCINVDGGIYRGGQGFVYKF